MQGRFGVWLIGFVAGLALMPVGSGALAQEAAATLFATVPDGVSVEVLSAGEGPTFRFHVDALRLDRITIDCGQVSGRLFGMEQVAWVEYGSVDVHDWETGELTATLTAGESIAPQDEEIAYFLTTSPGHRASVYRFSHGAAGAPGDEPAGVTFESTRCGSGLAQEVPADAAVVETLYAADMEAGTAFAPGNVVMGGVVTVAPGAAIGWFDAAHGPMYLANGAGVIVPLVGGFGTGAVGMAGITDPELRPGEILAFGPGQPIALENHGGIASISLVFGVVDPGGPLFGELDTESGCIAGGCHDAAARHVPGTGPGTTGLVSRG